MFNFSRSIVLVIFFLSLNSFAVKLTNILLVGNPGVGKSSIINALVGEKIAVAGFSAGKGLTTFFKPYPKDDKVFMDTPGLADTRKRQEAGEEIGKALKQGGDYRIFFVVKLDGGRVRSDDVATITTVMDAIDIENKQFNIIINQVTKEDKIDFAKNVLSPALALEELNSGKYKTDRVYFLDYDKHYRRENKNLLTIDAGFYAFINDSSYEISIVDPENEIKPINTNTFEELQEEYSENVNKLHEELKNSEKKQKELSENLKKVAEEMSKTAENYEKKLKESEAKAQAKIDEINKKSEIEKEEMKASLKREQEEEAKKSKERLDNFKKEMEGKNKEAQEKLKKEFAEKEAAQNKKNEENEEKHKAELKRKKEKHKKLLKEQQEKSDRAVEQIRLLATMQTASVREVHHYQPASNSNSNSDILSTVVNHAVSSVISSPVAAIASVSGCTIF